MTFYNNQHSISTNIEIHLSNCYKGQSNFKIIGEL